MKDTLPAGFPYIEARNAGGSEAFVCTGSRQRDPLRRRDAHGTVNAASGLPTARTITVKALRRVPRATTPTPPSSIRTTRSRGDETDDMDQCETQVVVGAGSSTWDRGTGPAMPPGQRDRYALTVSNGGTDRHSTSGPRDLPAGTTLCLPPT